jgi:hypothetical protein
MRIILILCAEHAFLSLQSFAGRHPPLVPAGCRSVLTMAHGELWAGALSLVLIHAESGCPHSALNAARLLNRLCDSPELNESTRALCERASERLTAAAGRASGTN